MDKLTSTKATIKKLPEVTFPVLVEGTILHFPISRRSAPIGTIHKWGDGHKYRKTASGWELYTEPGSGEAPGEPEETPKEKPVPDDKGKEPEKEPEVPPAQPPVPGKAHVAFRDGKHRVYDADGKEVSSWTFAKSAAAALNAHIADQLTKAKADAQASASNEPDTRTDFEKKHPGYFDVIGQSKWEKDLKVGDEVEVRWTGSGMSHRARAKVLKNSDSSVRVALLHGVKSYHSGDRDTWTVGDHISVPKTMNFNSRRLNFNSKWSQSNGVFPVSDKTKPADTSKLDAHADVVKHNGTAKNYARGDRIIVHYPEKDPNDKHNYSPSGDVEYEVEKALYKNNLLAVKPITKGLHIYGTSIRLDAFSHKIDKKNDPKPEMAPEKNPLAGATPQVVAQDTGDRKTSMPRMPSTPATATHAVVADEIHDPISYHHSEEEAKATADQLTRYHGRSFYTAPLEGEPEAVSPKGAHEPDAEHTVTHDSSGDRPIKHYDTKSVKRDPHVPQHHTHAVVNSDTGEVLATFGQMSTTATNAAGGNARGNTYDMHGKPLGRRAHVDTLEPFTDEHKAVQDAHRAAAQKKHDDARAAYQHSPDRNWIKGPEQLKPVIPARPKHVPQELHDKIVDFAHKVAAKKAELAIDRGHVDKVHVHNFTPSVKYKRTYAYVDIGGSGKYMIPLTKPNGKMAHTEVGTVHAIDSAYGVPHPYRKYGNVLKGDAVPGNMY